MAGLSPKDDFMQANIAMRQLSQGKLEDAAVSYTHLDTNFTGYAGNAFGLEHQKNLAECAKKAQKEKQISVVISNHDTKFTREDVYKRQGFSRTRFSSCWHVS